MADTTLVEWEKRKLIPRYDVAPLHIYIAAVMHCKYLADRVDPNKIGEVEQVVQMARTQGGRNGGNVDPFHAVVLGIQREEKCTFHKAALLAGERDPEAYEEYRKRNTRGTPEFRARQASLRGEEAPRTPRGEEPPRTARVQSATMAKIFELRKQHIADAAALGRKITITQADQRTWEEFPHLYLAYLKENTR